MFILSSRTLSDDENPTQKVYAKGWRTIARPIQWEARGFPVNMVRKSGDAGKPQDGEGAYPRSSAVYVLRKVGRVKEARHHQARPSGRRRPRLERRQNKSD